MQAGTYATDIAPINAGTSIASRLVFLGSAGSSTAATVPDVILGHNSSYLTVKWLGVGGTISVDTTATYDSLYCLTDTSAFVHVMGSNCILSRCTIGGRANVDFEGTCPGHGYPCGNLQTYASNDTIVDCTGNIQHSISAEDVILLTLLRYPYVARNHFTITGDTAIRDTDGQYVTLKWVIGGQFIDNYWSIINNTNNSWNPKIAFNVRDSSRANLFLRDTVIAQGSHNGTTTTAIYLANSGTLFHTVGGNRYEGCYFKNAVESAATYMDWIGADTLQNCSLISDAGYALNCAQEPFNEPGFLFRHNAAWASGQNVVIFQPTSIASNCRFVSNVIYGVTQPACFPYSTTTTCMFQGTLALVDSNLVYSPGGDSTAAIALNGGGAGNCLAPNAYAPHTFWGSPALTDSSFSIGDFGRPNLHPLSGSFALGTEWADRYVGPLHAVPSSAGNVREAANGVSTQIVTWTEPLYYVNDNCSFDLRQSKSQITNGTQFAQALQIATGQPVAPGQLHCVSVGNLNACTRYYYAVRLSNDVGVGGISNSPSGLTRCIGGTEVYCTNGPLSRAVLKSSPGGKGDARLAAPQALTLDPPQPNPALGDVVLSYGIPWRAEGEFALGVFDVAGRRLAEISSGKATPGFRTVVWKASEASGARLKPGMYFVRLTAGWEKVVRAVAIR